MEELVEQLRKWAHEQPYEEGWHWIVETHDRADYKKALEEAGGDLEKAKNILTETMKLTLEQESNTRWE